MDRKKPVNREARNPLDRSHGRVDRRRFLSGASKYGALLVGAGSILGKTPFEAGRASAQGGAEEFPVEEKGIIRVLGVVQRRSGLTRMQVKFRSPDFDFSAADRAFIAGTATGIADSRRERRPTGVGAYYRWVHAQLTKNEPGQNVRHIHNVVADGAFGDGSTPCTALVNRDLVAELYYQSQGQKPAAARPEPNPPDSVEGGTALNLAVQQVLAHGTRPEEASGGEKIMHFIKLSSPVGAADQVTMWQTLHAKALEANQALGGGLQGYELLQRLPDTPARQTTQCAGEVPVPELVACFWPKKGDGGAVWENYMRAFRRADTQKALDNGASFFLVVQEYQYF